MKKTKILLSLLVIPMLASCGGNNTVPSSGNSESTSTISPVAEKVTVKFVSEDGETIIDSQEIDKGSIPVFAGLTPRKDSTAEFTYTFVGWTLGDTLYSPTDTLPAANEDTTYVATFTATKNSYLISFYLDNKTAALQSTQLEYGVQPSYEGAIPQLQSSIQYDYEFDGWTYLNDSTVYTAETLPVVTGDADYYAHFAEVVRQYTVTFVNDDDTVISSMTLDYGATVTVPDEPEKESSTQYNYIFAGWADENGNTYDSANIPVVYGDVTYKATYESDIRSYNVYFKDEFGIETLQASKVNYGVQPVYSGETPVKESTAEYAYAFAGWKSSVTKETYTDSTLPTVTGSVTYTAVFSEVVREYTVTYKDDDGTILGSETLEYGTAPTGAGLTPSKEGTAEYNYIFAGWSTDGTTVLTTLPDVTGNTTYIAVYTKEAVEYNVTINYLNVIDNSFVHDPLEIKERYSSNNIYEEVSPTVEGLIPNVDVVKHLTKGDFFATVYYSAISTYDSGASASSLTGSGTETDPYMITSVAEWNFFKSSLDSTTYKDEFVKLGKSLDFGGNNFELPTAAASFAGTFDGNNCVIQGYAGTKGLFGYLGANATIKNLSVKGTVTAAAAQSGGFACNAQLGAKLENCYNYVNVSTTSNSCGGFIGLGKVEMLNCYNYGTVTSTHATNGANKTGGFVGSLANVAGSTFSDCENYGAVVGKSGTGGIVGIGDLGTSITVEFNRCVNAAPVSASYSTANDLCGGLMGGTNKASIVMNFNDCVNVGSVSCSNKSIGTTCAGKIGGILGGPLTAGTSVQMTNCTNYGAVEGQSCTGGLIGYAGGISVGEFIMSNCNNYGTVSEIDTVTTSNASVAFGGVIGLATGAITKGAITGCNNYGYIEASTELAGVVGMINASAETLTFENCNNYGNVHATNVSFDTGSKSSYAAGITGWSRSTLPVIYKNCNNYGKIDAATLGGLGGIIGFTGGNTNITIDSCDNNGEVISPTNTAGGILGMTTSSAVVKLEIKNSCNNGLVKGVNNIGGIVGTLYEVNAGTVTIADNCLNNGIVEASGTVYGDIVGNDKRA